MPDTKISIHPTAVIDAGAQIGNGTRIWHFCHLMPYSRVGENCILGQNVFIDNNAIVGNGVKIQNNVSVYNGVVIEDEAFIGPSVVFTNVINPRSFIERKNEFKKTLVKKGASIGANATILCGVEIGSYLGNPARLIGWVSKAGHKLDFDPEGIAQCPETGRTYKLQNNRISPIN
jgi:UDP-2-acetamido-3-amino-2,3-dideoxy-glucuronate N-acetyltransferase